MGFLPLAGDFWEGCTFYLFLALKDGTQWDGLCPYLHICNGFQLLLLLWLPPLEILHQVLDVGANLGEVQVHVLYGTRQEAEGNSLDRVLTKEEP